jgi:hypothetical protein
MLHRLLAALAFPAHLVNRPLDGLMGRLRLRRVPGSLLVGLVIAALAISTATATLAAYEARPTAQPVTISQVANGRTASGLWVEFDAELLDGPHVATVSVSSGGGVATEVDRVHYLVVDPAAPELGLIVRFREPIGELETPDGRARLDGTITQDQFNMRSLLEGWGLADLYPDVDFSESRLIAYAFETPWQEPSWIATFLLAALALLFLGGSLVPQPLFHAAPLTPAPGETPIPLTIYGELPTPRGAVRLRGAAARLEWMNVGEVARTQWRYWGAELGDVRRDVEEAVLAHGQEGERLVVHGQTGSVLWPIEGDDPLDLEAGDAFLGRHRHPALRVSGGGASATLTFADAAARDAAAAELTAT